MMEEELKILSDYSISDKELEAKYPYKINDEYILSFLEEIYSKQNGEIMEFMSRLAYRISNLELLAPIFNKLIKENWHKQHEDIALFFESSVYYPNCIDNVIEAMHLKLNYWYDDGDAFIRKCAYVLGKIKTSYAIEKLRELSKSNNAIIKKYCSHQLEKLG